MTPAIIIGAISAFAQFLNTPPGQAIATNANDIIVDIFKLFHVHLQNVTPMPAK